MQRNLKNKRNEQSKFEHIEYIRETASIAVKLETWYLGEMTRCGTKWYAE
jgi:hypothetical protein